MKREDPPPTCSSPTSALYDRDDRHGGLHDHRCMSSARAGRSLLAIKRTCRRGSRRHQCGALADVRHDALRRDGGAAGGIYAVILLVVTPQTVFGALTSAQALIVTLFGGVGSSGGRSSAT
jgi:hypothetical protein